MCNYIPVNNGSQMIVNFFQAYNLLVLCVKAACKN